MVADLALVTALQQASPAKIILSDLVWRDLGMEIVTGGEHEEMAFDYQIIEIARLNETLKRYGIVDKEVRKQICCDYLFGNAYFFDAGWFMHEGKQLYPQLCFAERNPDPDTHLGEIQVIYTSSQDYDLHESAFANADWYFEEHQEDASEIKTGSYDQEDETE